MQQSNTYSFLVLLKMKRKLSSLELWAEDECKRGLSTYNKRRRVVNPEEEDDDDEYCPRIQLDKWDDAYKQISGMFDRQYNEIISKRQLLPRNRAVVEARLAAGGLHSIDLQAIFTTLRKTFASFQFVPTEQQRMFFDVAMVVAMEKIIGEQYELLKPRILEAINMDELFSSFHLVTPRQYGKSTAVAMTVLALALNVVGIRICIFSTGKRTAEALMTMIRQCLRSRPELANRVIKETNEEMLISPVPITNKNVYDLAKCSRIRCFPANANSK